MHAISSYRGNRPTNTHTHTQTRPITTHCAAASAQCNKVCNRHYEGTEEDGDQETPGEEIFLEYGDSMIRVQLEKDGGDDSGQNWMEKSGLWPTYCERQGISQVKSHFTLRYTPYLRLSVHKLH